MTEADVARIWPSSAMLTAAKIAAPICSAAMAVGLLVSIFQSVTQIQEMTLTFVPKLLGRRARLLFAGHWMLDTIIGYVDTLFNQIPQLLGS